MSDEPKRRGRPPGSKNKIKRPKPKSARVESRKREAKAARPKRPARPPVEEVQAEIVLPGEEFGSRQRQPEPEEPELPGQMAFVWPRRRGRPEGSGALLKCDDATLDRIWSVGTRQGTQHELAVRLGVSLSTVQRFFEQHPLARETFEDAAAAGLGSLRSHFYQEAMSGNTPVLLSAAKNLLGFDKPKEDPNKAGAIPRDMIEAAADEFKRLATDFVERRRAKAVS